MVGCPGVCTGFPCLIHRQGRKDQKKDAKEIGEYGVSHEPQPTQADNHISGSVH
jgi:hypothetical protein